MKCLFINVYNFLCDCSIFWSSFLHIFPCCFRWWPSRTSVSIKRFTFNSLFLCSLVMFVFSMSPDSWLSLELCTQYAPKIWVTDDWKHPVMMLCRIHLNHREILLKSKRNILAITEKLPSELSLIRRLWPRLSKAKLYFTSLYDQSWAECKGLIRRCKTDDVADTNFLIIVVSTSVTQCPKGDWSWMTI